MKDAESQIERLLSCLEDEADSWSFFAAVRAIERARADLPRIGRAASPDREPVDLFHRSTTSFPRSTVSRVSRRSRRPRLESYHLGLTGPIGPMPMHWTEFAELEDARRGPKPLNDFLGVLSVRMLQLHYRAWAESQPAVQADRSEDDSFAGLIAAVSGAADLSFLDPLESLPAPAEGFDSWRQLSVAGVFTGVKSASAVADALSYLVGQVVGVTENVGRWYETPPALYSRLDDSRPGYNVLGRSAAVGRRYFSVENDVVFTVKAASWEQFIDFINEAGEAMIIRGALDALCPDHLSWRVQVGVAEGLIEPAELGKSRLGETSWMLTRENRGGQLRTDYRMRSRGADVVAAPGGAAA